MSVEETENEDHQTEPSDAVSDAPEYAGVGTASLTVSVSETEDGKPYTIHGIALGVGDVTLGGSGVRKVWPGAELEAAAESLEGQPLVKNHENTAEGRIGTVTKSRYAPGVGILYEAEIAPHYEDFAKDIAAGILEVSARAYHAPTEELEEDDEQGALIVEDILFDNLSVVDKGAAPSNTAHAGPSPDLSPNAGAEAVASARVGGPETSEEVAVLSRGVEMIGSDEVLEMLDASTLTEDTESEEELTDEAESEPEPESNQSAEDAPSEELSEDESPTTESEQESTEGPVEDETEDVETAQEPVDTEAESSDEESLESEPVDENDDPTETSTEASSPESNLTAALSATFPTNMTDIQYGPASEDAIEEMEEPVVLEREDVESLKEQASHADELSERLSEVNTSIEEMGARQEKLDAVDQEKFEELSEADDPRVVDASEYDELMALVEDVGKLYADELEAYSPWSSEELTERFTPLELRDSVDQHEEAELSAEIESEDPEPEAGTVESEELSESEEELEREASEKEAREYVASELEQMGWNKQAEKVREGQIALEELGVEIE